MTHSASDDRYTSPLSTRNASPEMQTIWSSNYKFTTWRKLWLALAQAQQQLGLPVEQSQVDALAAHMDDLDLEAAAQYEKKLRHDVMAHVHALGDQAPEARAIIHLGATSQFVNCNTELLQIRETLELLARKLAVVIHQLADFASEHRALPTLGFTHYQPAQPTTVGKRAALWAYDLVLALSEIEHRLDSLKFRGVKGTTGTQASFLALFLADGNRSRSEAMAMIDQLDEKVTAAMGWPTDKRFAITGQTYPRVFDAALAGTMGMVASATQKMATDMRLLQSRKELEEPFEKSQIGSSAMAYKRNPMRSERICGLSRFVIGMTQTPMNTAGEQWFERTLDDSSCRRLTLPEPMLALDGVLDIAINVTQGLVVYPKVIEANLMAELPFMASENLMMAAVRNGADRQEVHEIIRTHSQAAAAVVKEQGKPNDLLERLEGEPAFAGMDLRAELDPVSFVGLAPEQVDRFIVEIVEPIRGKYRDALDYQASLSV